MRLPSPQYTLSAVQFLNVLPTTTDYRNSSFPGPINVVSFGDSMSDNGNGTYLATAKQWPSDPAYDRGRFTNGLVWVEVFAEQLGVPIDDRAHGGATSDNSLVPGLTGPDYKISVPSLTDQVQSYIAEPHDYQNTFYTLLIGGNDLFFDPKVDPLEVSKRLIRAVETLREKGAARVLVSGAGSSPERPDLGLVITNELRKAFEQWKAQVVVFDIQETLRSIVANASQLNLTELQRPCLNGVYKKSEPRTLCTKPDNHLYWDDFHPTARVHQLVGLEAFRVSKVRLLFALASSHLSWV